MRAANFLRLLGILILRCRAGVLFNFGESVHNNFELTNDIPKLNNSTFSDFLKTKQSVLVLFYSPWDPLSRFVMPNFIEASRMLANNEPPVSFATLDIVESGDVANEENVTTYPVFKLYLDGVGHVYDGDYRHFHYIANWVMSHTGSHLVISSEDHLADVMSSHEDESIVFGYLKGSHVATDAFIKVARAVDGPFFAEIGNAKVLQLLESKYKLPPRKDNDAPFLVMFAAHDNHNPLSKDSIFVEEGLDKFQNTLKDGHEGLILWCKKYIHPPVIHFHGKSLRTLFSQNLPIVVMFHPDTETFFSDAPTEVVPESIQTFHESAEDWLGQVIFVLSGTTSPEERRLLDTLGSDHFLFPAVRLMQLAKKNRHDWLPVDKFKPSEELDGQEEISSQSISDFISSVISLKIKPYLKSEPVPDAKERHVPGSLTVLVADNFVEKVLQNYRMETFVVLYAPWCGHCRKMEPALNELARFAAGMGHLQIAKIDATRNEIPNVHITGYPTILFYGKNKHSPLTYSGDRTAEAMFSWIGKNSAKKFDPVKERVRSQKILDSFNNIPKSSRDILEEL